MTKTPHAAILFLLLLGGCTLPAPGTAAPADLPSMQAPPTAGVEHSTPRREAPLYLTTMTHMEGNWNDDTNQALFQRHVTQLRYGMDLAEEYGALLTIESEKPFARASSLWGVNILAEVRERGFGVGTHCDIGYNEPRMSVAEFADLFTENKSLVDALIGAGNNLGCSGGGSVNDWARAASQAGFKYLDGIVGMHYLSMPLANRPSPEWTDDFIRDGAFHLNSPIELEQRIYLVGLADGSDFLADPDPVIVLSSGELGLLSAMAERGREYGGGPVLRDDEYTFDRADVDSLEAVIREVDQWRDRGRIAKLCVYLPSNAYEPANEAVLRDFFERMQALEQEGLITWATQRQVYEAYLAWNE